MIKIAHEAPNQIFDTVSSMTDIDYALVHLFEESSEYFNNFKRSIHNGREVILDNSLFELGHAFDTERYASWIHELKPSWYILPDVWEDGFETIREVTKFKHHYNGLLPGKTIAVAQGATLHELLFCFDFMHNEPFVDMIAISFGLSFYETLSDAPNQLQRSMEGRQFVISHLNELYQRNYFHKKVHLLGTFLPQEGLKYKNMDWIYSMDTSNPVMHGYENNKYSETGMTTKSSTKLFTIIDNHVDSTQLENIKYNISEFRKLWTHSGQ